MRVQHLLHHYQQQMLRLVPHFITRFLALKSLLLISLLVHLQGQEQLALMANYQSVTPLQMI